MENKLERKYGLFTAICMVIGIVIGSGIFFKAQGILQKTGGDLVTGILAWAIGGAIMLVCLLAFSFMGQKYEKVNGLVDYAEATVGKAYGYYIGWFATTIYYPSMTSVLCWVSAQYTLEFLKNLSPVIQLTGPTALSPECMILAMVYLCLAYTMNALSPKLAGKFQTTTTVIKLIPLVLMAVVGTVVGLFFGDQQLRQNFAHEAAVQAQTSPLFGAVCSTAFAYEGWIIATSINSEIKDSKKNLPRALVIGGIVIVAVYLFYFIGIAGGASVEVLQKVGAPQAFLNIFGNGFGNLLNLFVAISCLGTLNGLMVGATRGMYAVASRGEGPKADAFAQVDKHTNMPHNSAVIGLLVTGLWLGYFYLANLHPGLVFGDAWQGGPFCFDSSELPIITIYFMYLPMFVMWMIKEKDQSVLRRFVMPILAFCGSVFMVVACVISHKWACVWYLIVFAVIMVIGGLFRHARKAE